MNLDRRDFVKSLGLTVLGGASCAGASAARASGAERLSEDRMGVLVDIPNCIGCRKCEFACQQTAGFETPPMEAFEDKSVFETYRRPNPRGYTTVNRYADPSDPAKAAYVKINCLHCNEPACVSACLVGALRKQPNGAVTYEPWKCMGCRYCMVACPFQIPTYEYDNPLTPQVRKCTFCFERTGTSGQVPACVKICPNDALIYGKSSELLTIAHERIRSRPELYVDHVYGEHEAGGTSWMYLASSPFEQLGFLQVGSMAPSKRTETIQHAIFKWFMPPLALYGLLATVMRMAKPEPSPQAVALLGEGKDEHADGNGNGHAQTEGAGVLPREAGRVNASIGAGATV